MIKNAFWLLIILFASSLALGDVSIRQGLILSENARKWLQSEVVENPEAKSLWEEIRMEAEGKINLEPSPVQKIHYEGRLDNDPKRVETLKHLMDMDHVSLFGQAYAASGEVKYAEKIKDFCLAWADKYHPDGNTINENKLEPLWLGYAMVREIFSEEEKEKTENWFLTIAEKQFHADVPKGNWEAKRFKISGFIGMILKKQEYVDYSLQKFRDLVNQSLHFDGTSRDFHHRDAMRYHVNTLVPLVVYALGAQQAGYPGLYTYQSPDSASVRNSTRFIDPYAKGEKIHMEFENTNVQLDRDRREAGLPGYSGPWDPEQSLKLYAIAAAFEPINREMAVLVSDGATETYPNWQALVSTAAFKAGEKTSFIHSRNKDPNPIQVKPFSKYPDVMGRFNLKQKTSDLKKIYIKKSPTR